LPLNSAAIKGNGNDITADSPIELTRAAQGRIGIGSIRAVPASTAAIHPIIKWSYQSAMIWQRRIHPSNSPVWIQPVDANELLFLFLPFLPSLLFLLLLLFLSLGSFHSSARQVAVAAPSR